jgi:hypothetical protein
MLALHLGKDLEGLSILERLKEKPFNLCPISLKTRA